MLEDRSPGKHRKQSQLPPTPELLERHLLLPVGTSVSPKGTGSCVSSSPDARGWSPALCVRHPPPAPCWLASEVHGDRTLRQRWGLTGSALAAGGSLETGLVLTTCQHLLQEVPQSPPPVLGQRSCGGEGQPACPRLKMWEAPTPSNPQTSSPGDGPGPSPPRAPRPVPMRRGMAQGALSPPAPRGPEPFSPPPNSVSKSWDISEPQQGQGVLCSVPLDTQPGIWSVSRAPCMAAGVPGGRGAGPLLCRGNQSVRGCH